MSFLKTALVLAMISAPGFLASQQPVGIDRAKAETAFQEAKQLSNQDGGKLWGQTLYGPMLFVSPRTREVVANEGDPDGVLKPEGAVFTGQLPRNILIANTATEWSGKRWTMVMWPLPESRIPRERLLVHELFHRIQPSLGLRLASPDNPQLDSEQGRLWLQLEWRALAIALTSTGQQQRTALANAITFRHHRFSLFPGAQASEEALEDNEGLAEYTGVRLSAPDEPSARWRAVQQLVSPNAGTFVRSFAYTSGPAYGLLLDEIQPVWRRSISRDKDMADLIAAKLSLALTGNAETRAVRYGAKALAEGEEEREAMAKSKAAAYRALLIDGPTLLLPNAGKFSYGFNPNELVPLGSDGTVYPTMQATDDWGKLEVEEGALLSPDFKKVTVAAPTEVRDPNGNSIQGPGWTLTLEHGWKLVPLASKAGSFMLSK